MGYYPSNSSFKDLSGDRVGDWEIIKVDQENSYPRSIYYLCKCLRCGNLKSVSANNLKAKTTLSCCGKSKHNAYKTREYHIYLDMRKRCYDVNHKAYPNYGGRGITMCDSWIDPVNGFINFIADMGGRPSEKHTIERLDNSLGYSVTNCSWETMEVQQRNRRNNTVTEDEVKAIRYDREVMGLSHLELAAKYNKKVEQIGKLCRYVTWKNIHY